MIDALVAGLEATSPAEALSVLLGIAYVVLAVRRQRLAWIAGGLSSAILVPLYAARHLPMQSALNAFYVVMSFYGWAQWSRAAETGEGVGVLPLRWHLLAWLAIGLAAVLSARVLAAETEAAWPFCDALTTWASLFTTWLAARSKLENWLYWIAIDAVIAVLSAAQGLVSVALLFALYLGFSVAGFAAWWRRFRAAPVQAAAAT